jgi:hypothetical protein
MFAFPECREQATLGLGVLGYGIGLAKRGRTGNSAHVAE